MVQDNAVMDSKNIPEYSNSPYVRKIEKPWGYEIHWVPDKAPYMGKLLHINEGKRLSLQSHDKKTESWWLLSGKAMLIIENNEGEMEEIEMESGVGYRCEIGQKHRLMGVTDCEIMEVSTPEIGTTTRHEDDFNRKDETEEARDERNKGN